MEMGMDVLVASTGMDESRARAQVERLVPGRGRPAAPRP